MAKYATKTTVTAEKSRLDIERTLAKYGATRFVYGYDPDKGVIGFQMNERHVKFIVPFPDPEDEEFLYDGRGYQRSTSSCNAAYEQAVRQRWRALALAIKAKLEAVECEIVSFEEEFLAHLVLPDGSTVGSVMIPQIQVAYDSGKMPKMLPWGG